MASGDLWRGMGLGRPGRGLVAVLALLTLVWLGFAIAVNWLGVGQEWFLLFAGNTERILAGQVWRLFTAPLLHAPGTVSHLLWTVLGFLFLSTRLEERWGTARFLRFLLMSSVFAYAVQMLLEILLPGSLGRRLVGPYWFGSVPTLTAIAVAWALTFRQDRIQLFFVLPVTSTGLVVFIAVVSVLRIVAADMGAEGLLSPFGGMLAGWLFGGGTPSPIRRAYLRLRLAQLDREAGQSARDARARKKDSPFRVIEGGRGRGGSAGTKGQDGGPGGRMLH